MFTFDSKHLSMSVYQDFIFNTNEDGSVQVHKSNPSGMYCEYLGDAATSEELVALMSYGLQDALYIRLYSALGSGNTSDNIM